MFKVENNGLFGLKSFQPVKPLFGIKRRREVKTVAEILEVDLVHISGIKQVRWMASKTRALTALLKNFVVIVSHLEHVAARKSGDEAARAKGYLKDLTTFKFIIMLHAMVDILSVLAFLSKVFQQKDLLVTDVYPQVEAHLLRLEELKHNPGTHLKKAMSSDFNIEKNTFCGVQVKGDNQKTEFINSIIDDMVTHVDQRFQHFNTSPLKCFEALDYRTIPQDRFKLTRHGNDSIKTLLDHFKDIFPETSHDEILSDYAQMKVYMRNFQQSDDSLQEVYSRLLRSPGSTDNIKKLIQLMMVVSPSTAECERGFSAMNLIKSTTRNCLNQDSLQMVMTVKQLGPSLEDFDPDEAISHLMKCGKGGRHISGHKTVSGSYCTKL